MPDPQAPARRGGLPLRHPLPDNDDVEHDERMGWLTGITNDRWTHRCGGKATPGERCDYCDKKLKGTADATWDRPAGWTPPGEDTDAGRVFSIW